MVKVDDIGIVGGGSAGWLAALYFKKNFPNSKITIIEDPDSNPIIAGESCTIPFVELLEHLDIDFFDWIKKTEALPKLGGVFKHWKNPSSLFIQPLFSRYLNRWLFQYPEYGNRNDLLKSSLVLDIPIDKITPAGNLIKCKKTPWTSSGDMILKPMYHFDSRKNAAYLKKLGIERGVRIIEQKVLSYEIFEGGVKNLILENNKITFDFYIDCTGFKQLLLQKALKGKFEDYSKFISNSSVVAWWDESDLLPYTEMTAMEAGWRFNVSLRDRSGNGYIYDNSIISEEQAIIEIEKQLGKSITPIASMTWNPSLSLEPWKKNVFSIGLSNGFLEPLGSPGHTMIALQLKLFDTLWNGHYTEEVIVRYNKQYAEYVKDTLDFITLHYLGSYKDNYFWKARKDKSSIPESLIEKINFINLGIFDDSEFAVYSIENYLAVMQGLDLIDKSTLVNTLNYKNEQLVKLAEEEIGKIDKETSYSIQNCIPINEWIKTYG